MPFACEPVSSTPRGKRLSIDKRTALHDRQGGICPLCNQPMVSGDKLVDEHLRALGLGGSNDLDNRALVHGHCAYAKTYGSDGDLARIARAKRRKARSLGLFAPKRPIESAGFAPPPPQNTCRSPEKPGFSALPRRSLYVPDSPART